jgi:hypothetical protein
VQYCKNCGREIKYIAVKNDYILCDAGETAIVTENGIIRRGYKIHECEERKDGDGERKV